VEQISRDATREVLATIAARLRTAVRAGDTPARLSGDEFVVGN
jgi:GGDEF domain-containing protein